MIVYAKDRVYSTAKNSNSKICSLMTFKLLRKEFSYEDEMQQVVVEICLYAPVKTKKILFLHSMYLPCAYEKSLQSTLAGGGVVFPKMLKNP